MREVMSYAIHEVEPYINWLYFYHAWQMGNKTREGRGELHDDAMAMLRDFDREYATHAVVGIYEANSEGDDIIVGGLRMPMLRQQTPDPAVGACLSLADFVRPASTGIADRIGVFAATVDMMMENSHDDDPYARMLAQTLADRLAEATAEKVHQEVRTRLWGYAPDEHLTIDEMHAEAFQGIRPAVGYPSLPDTSLNFIIDRLVDIGEIGIRLTEHGAMRPHASVSGLMIAHPEARYFNIGKIGDDQLHDYAMRRGVPLELARKFLSTSIMR
ncbi:MAG: 5-methyltetrahydrofolate--homocysteine methyltransferase [Prevotella sp.]|nr:5-methyltetrahydrofolate--homocysteine methyltransferase [Prevotella sp.]